ncbi:polysaccharide biosynthesis protein [Tumebacillus algifaecis]|uniref:Polysaccharide biosynthesis protein n=1 Tax=Tumebacillus algifaecis TaxID=1214604 RepID=A0A223D5N8_9BACL|nr:nucleoside-diphosphate sugar epimerase/dehydratase [Tumebacillus algifaecis]ASS76726.1 polysaccharide biosynthesis protein [Tumebacillus algifaecis]
MNGRLRLLTLGALDACIAAMAVTLAYCLRFDFQVLPQFMSAFPYLLLMHVVLTPIIFYAMKMYHSVLEYASIGELKTILKATVVAGLILTLIQQMIHLQVEWFVVPRTVLLLTWLLTLLGVGGMRLAQRMFRDAVARTEPSLPSVLIVGAGSAGVLIARELKTSPYSTLNPVAFIDDDLKKQGLSILGLPVVGGRSKIPHAVEKYGVQKILIAIPSALEKETAQILEICKLTNCQISTLPRVADIVAGKVSVNMIREVSVEDLLGREAVTVDLEGVASYVSDQVVLVTGAGGSIGSELCRQISKFAPKQLLLLGHGENSIYEIELELRNKFPALPLVTIIADIQDRKRLNAVFDTYRPSVVFHAAAHKHVPLMERNPQEAIKNNVLGTMHVAECAHEYGAKRFVMISSDKAVNPTSVMGVSKRVAEMVIQGLDRISQTQFVAVRFGNVLGSRGSVIPIFKRQILAGGPVTVTHPDMVRYFMTIPEASQLVVQAGALAEGGEIFILDMGAPVNIADLARDLIRLSGLRPEEDIDIVYTGIRPGEKLFEEILTNEEGTEETKHNRIFVGRPLDFSWEELQFMIKRLEQMAFAPDVERKAEAIKALFKQIVPTYLWKPQEGAEEHARKELEASLAEVAAHRE